MNRGLRAALKAEILKLTTIRSTYIVTAAVLLLVGGVNFYFNGYKATPFSYGDPNFLYMTIKPTFTIIGTFAAIVSILAVTHEYRYNTIVYSLLAANRRWKFFVAKVMALSAYALVFSLALVVVVLGALLLGLQLQGAAMGTQNLQLAELLGRGMLFVWAYSMLGMATAFLIRNQAASIVVLLIWPATVEPLLSLILKAKTAYLPFEALNSLLNGGRAEYVHLSGGATGLVVAGYVLAIGAVAYVLFSWRDAN